MAKLDETDPRWLVENRTDGKNVNNWHWAEMDLMKKCREKLPAFVKDVKIESPDVKELFISRLDVVEGDMSLANRKGKILFFYDLHIKLKWEGILNDDNKGKGGIEIIDLCDTDWPTYEVRITMEDELSSNKKLKEIMKASAPAVLKKIFTEFLAEMKGTATPQAPSPTQESHSGSSSSQPLKTSTSSPTTTTKSETAGTVRSIKMDVHFQCQNKMLFETLLDPQRVSAFTLSPAQISSQVGSEFKLFSGNVTGSILEIDPPKKLVQKWRFNSWPQNHFSKVVMEFKEEGSKTTLSLSQTGVPENDYERTRAGWETFFWSRIRSIFGWSYKIDN